MPLAKLKYKQVAERQQPIPAEQHAVRGHAASSCCTYNRGPFLQNLLSTLFFITLGGQTSDCKIKLCFTRTHAVFLLACHHTSQMMYSWWLSCGVAVSVLRGLFGCRNTSLFVLFHLHKYNLVVFLLLPHFIIVMLFCNCGLPFGLCVSCTVLQLLGCCRCPYKSLLPRSPLYTCDEKLMLSPPPPQPFSTRMDTRRTMHLHTRPRFWITACHTITAGVARRCCQPCGVVQFLFGRWFKPCCGRYTSSRAYSQRDSGLS